ncbi:MAG: hypothetical protein JO085_05900 [Acidimicrobiia bacterium]|nr:hypothetical protein [Acidimicrobiia bacterium]
MSATSAPDPQPAPAPVPAPSSAVEAALLGLGVAVNPAAVAGSPVRNVAPTSDVPAA